MFNHLFGEHFLWPAPLAELRSKYNRFFQNSRATFASSPFSYRGKSHSVRLRGVAPKIRRKRKRPKKERLKKWFVSTKMLEAWLLVTCCCCQGHATAPTHHIGRLCQRRALFVLARGELSGLLHAKLSVRGVFRRMFGRAIFKFWRGKSPRFRLLQTRARQFSVEKCKLWLRSNMNGGSAAR